MTVVVRLGENGKFLATPWVTARAVMPLPAPTGQAGDDPIELQLLEVGGPPEVVAAAVERLGDYLDDVVPVILAAYDGEQGGAHPSPQGG